MWPDEAKHQGFKRFIIEYYWKMFRLSKALLKGFALALGKSEDFFDNVYNPEDTISSLRLIRYPYIEEYPPVITAPDGQKLSFDTHTDVSLLTILYQPRKHSAKKKYTWSHLILEKTRLIKIPRCFSSF